jgi:hypothetical protein
MQHYLNRSFNTFFKDKEGHIVMWQYPNALLAGWVLCRLDSLLVNGNAENIVSYLGTFLLAIWAVLEITQGASYFRRMLGGIVLFAILTSVISS